MPPEQTIQLINEFTERTKAILRGNLVGVYLHGSAVMGCFNPHKSDLDFITVVNEPLTDTVKRAYMDMVIDCNARGPAKGIEMSVVTRDVCSPFVYPTPFDLHFSAGHLKWYTANPSEYISQMKGTDKDLAAHFTIIGHRGQCLWGAPISKVFADVPVDAYMDSIWYDVENAVDEIADNTMYLTLNLARVMAYKAQGLVLSKQEGGEWAMDNLPAQYHPLITAALSEYTHSATVAYDQPLARQYADYVTKRIHSAAT